MTITCERRHKPIRALRYSSIAFLISLLGACAVQKADFPKAWTQPTEGRPGQCPELSGTYPDIPEVPGDTVVYPENYASFRLHWLITGDMSYPQPEKIKDVTISLSRGEVIFNFLDASGYSVSTRTYPQGSYACIDHQLIITAQQRSIGELMAINSRKYELHFMQGANDTLLLKLTTVDHGAALIVIPYRIAKEQIYRFKKLHAYRRPYTSAGAMLEVASARA